jgi:prepilin-type N-terminal cleavage/methylation domain-containing protein/prepilin-type processing-associated H-X9-DG protein
VSGRKHCAFTLIELLAVIGVMAILAAILFPLLTSATEKGNKTRCVSNLRQWGAGMALFLSDHGGVFPSNGLTGGSLDVNKSGAWFNVIPLSMGTEPLSNLVAISQAPGPTPPFNHNIYTCPTLKASQIGGAGGGKTPVFSYAYNKSIDDANRTNSAFSQILRISQIPPPSQFIVFGEVANSYIMDATTLVFRHGGGKFANLCFADGHVLSVEASSLTNLIWDP